MILCVQIVSSREIKALATLSQEPYRCLGRRNLHFEGGFSSDRSQGQHRKGKQAKDESHCHVPLHGVVPVSFPPDHFGPHEIRLARRRLHRRQNWVITRAARPQTSDDDATPLWGAILR
jgi:hypothetical protein